jgi:hypothetical protein
VGGNLRKEQQVPHIGHFPTQAPRAIGFAARLSVG